MHLPTIITTLVLLATPALSLPPSKNITNTTLPALTLTLTPFDDALAALPLNASAAELSAIFDSPIHDLGVALYCETSAASPPVVFTHQAANNLIKEHNYTCSVLNGVGSHCTRKKSYRGADISICGGWGNNVKCTTLAWAAKHIANKCKWSGLARGYYVFEDARVRAVVH